MISWALFKREMKGSWKTLLIFAAILTLYISMVISMYNPDTISMLEEFAETMPEVMAAVGMLGSPTNMTEFISAYLYGMLLLMFPMIFTILRANSLIAKYVDRGSMVTLVAAPVKRVCIAFTQMKVLAGGIFLLLTYCVILEIISSEIVYSGGLDIPLLLLLNVGLLCLHLFIGGICFLASCIFSDTKYSVGVGAGVPAFMFILMMLANTGGNAENAKYATFFTLFNPGGLLEKEAGAIAGIIILFVGALALYTSGIIVFSRKDLHI